MVFLLFVAMYENQITKRSILHKSQESKPPYDGRPKAFHSGKGGGKADGEGGIHDPQSGGSIAATGPQPLTLGEVAAKPTERVRLRSKRGRSKLLPYGIVRSRIVWRMTKADAPTRAFPKREHPTVSPAFATHFFKKRRFLIPFVG